MTYLELGSLSTCAVAVFLRWVSPSQYPLVVVVGKTYQRVDSILGEYIGSLGSFLLESPAAFWKGSPPLGQG